MFTCWHGEIGQTFDLPAPSRHRLQNEPREESEQRGQHCAGRKHGGRKSRDEAGFQKLDDHRRAEDDGDGGRDSAQQTEKLDRPFLLHQLDDQPQNPKTVAKGVQLAGRAFGAIAIERRHFCGRQLHLKRMNHEFGFDLEAGRHRRKRLHISAGKDLVAGQHVGDAGSEDVADQPGQQPVAEPVTGPERSANVRFSCAVDEIEGTGQQQRDQRRRTGGVVGVVAVRHHIDVGVDVGEHPPDDGALALPRLGANDGSCVAGALGRAVGRIVVVDIDGRVRQRTPEIGNNLADGKGFVEARNENCNSKPITGFRQTVHRLSRSMIVRIT